MKDQFGYDSDSFLGFNSHFISSFKPTEKKFRKTKQVNCYHYTSTSALKSILSNKPVLRFTDARYMNDRSEMVYCVKCLLEFLLSNKERYPYCLDVVNELLLKHHTAQDYIDLRVSKVEFSDIENMPYSSSRHFVFCMSESKDSLPMWNYYVRNGKYEGYNIGFDVYGFLKSFDTTEKKTYDPVIFQYGNVLYQTYKQNKEIARILDIIESRVFETYKVGRGFDVVFLRQYIESYGLFFKHQSFENEKEYRIVLSLSEQYLNSKRDNYFNKNLREMKLDFYERNGVFVPYMEVPINKDAIKEVTISPIIETDIAKSSLEEFLSIQGYYTKVSTSEIPIRF